MAGLLVMAFLPDEWAEFRELIEDLVVGGTGLYRWDEWRYEDGSRLRAASIVRTEGGPPLESVAADALAAAKQRGFFALGYEAPYRRTKLKDAIGRVLRIGQEPLPPRVIIDLYDPRVHLDTSPLPGVEDVLQLASQAGARTIRQLHRQAELDLEAPNRFFPPSTDFVVAGPYDRVALCRALASADFAEDGDAWIRDAAPEHGRLHTEVRLRDDVEIRLIPAVLRSIG